jgi:iron-sulfur cluster repair protein YtfE (RIC family)
MTSTQNMPTDQMLRSTLIRDLVEEYPAAMPVLQQHGIDICCGGGLTIPDAAKAHGHEPEALIQLVNAAIRGEGM